MSVLRCAEVEARLGDTLDGRLEPAESLRVHAHIERCASCRERAALWRGLVPALREAVPPEPTAMAVRRMQIEIERELAASPTEAPRRGAARWWRMPALGLAAAAVVALVWWSRPHPHGPRPETALREVPSSSPSSSPSGVASYAVLAAVHGQVTVAEDAGIAGAHVPTGASLVLAAEATAELTLERGATVHVAGPARLVLEGNARAVALRVRSGRVDAAVAHRSPDERFAVETDDLRVVVRGTKFMVLAGREGSRVEVSEGQVAVERPFQEVRLVSAGEAFDSAESEGAAPTVSPPGPDVVSCAEVTRACRATARATRAQMRAGDATRALRLLADARRSRVAVAGAGGGVAGDRCDESARACDDDLGYLNAEALNQAGRVDDAVAAYHALDRKGAPSAMRQNALYAAAQLQRRRGRLEQARADYEHAWAAAPRGALGDEALAGAMESAREMHDGRAARRLAARYLREFPRGLAAPVARRLAGAGTEP